MAREKGRFQPRVPWLNQPVAAGTRDMVRVANSSEPRTKLHRLQSVSVRDDLAASSQPSKFVSDVAGSLGSATACSSEALVDWYRQLDELRSKRIQEGADLENGLHVRCEAAQKPCPPNTLSGCCKTGSRDPVRHGTMRKTNWTWQLKAQNKSFIAASLASSDASCGVSRSVEGIMRYTNFTLVVLHVGCSSPCTDAERIAFSQHPSPRLWLNDECVPTERATGSIIHSHLRNIRLLTRAVDLKRIPPPSHFLMVSGDMVWQKQGVESHIWQFGSSVYVLPAQHKMSHPNSTLRWPLSRYDADLEAIASSTPAFERLGLLYVKGSNVDRAWMMGKHEGSFYPWSVARSFHDFLSRRGPLGRLNLRSCVHCGGAGCTEETYFPTFAAAQLLDPLMLKAQMRRELLEEHERDIYHGTITARFGHRTSDHRRFATKMLHMSHQYRCRHSYVGPNVSAIPDEIDGDGNDGGHGGAS